MRRSPISSLISVDLPTLGRPTIATRVPPPSAPGASAGEVCSWKSASAVSIKSPTPEPCVAEIKHGGPRASSWNSAPAARSRPSALFATTTTRRPRPGAQAFGDAQVLRGHAGAQHPLMNSSTSLSAIAVSVCSLIARCSPGPASGSNPPVSIARKRLSSHPRDRRRTAGRASVPESPATSAARDRVSRLNSVDLPTLVRADQARRPASCVPSYARFARFGGSLPWEARSAKQGEPRRQPMLNEACACARAAVWLRAARPALRHQQRQVAALALGPARLRPPTGAGQ